MVDDWEKGFPRVLKLAGGGTKRMPTGHSHWIPVTEGHATCITDAPGAPDDNLLLRMSVTILITLSSQVVTLITLSTY